VSRLPAALGVLLVGLLAVLVPGRPAAGAEGDGGKAETVVTFTFDGTFKGQEQAAQILADHGMAGTFFVNSGYLDYPAYLDLDALRSIARNRSEIGGASLYGNDLSRLPVDRAEHEICDDRMTLAQLGFQATSFAYPYGAGTPQVKSLVQQCGYNSARDIAGLYSSASDCSSCPKGETLPPTDDFRIRTNAPGVSLERLKREVRQAEDAGGGWVPLVFTYIGLDPAQKDLAISPDDFTAFVTWMQSRPTTTRVETVDQVMGGELKPPVGTPLERLVPDPSAAIGRTEPLSKVPAWTIFGVGIGQSQILLVGCLVAVAVIVTYRLSTRGNRYVRT
jgi:peptidoglycan/xylan/chitin deacetylase (PgdA/CDA1 family)